jgi:hypothetical protein
MPHHQLFDRILHADAVRKREGVLHFFLTHICKFHDDVRVVEAHVSIHSEDDIFLCALPNSNWKCDFSLEDVKLAFEEEKSILAAIQVEGTDGILFKWKGKTTWICSSTIGFNTLRNLGFRNLRSSSDSFLKAVNQVSQDPMAYLIFLFTYVCSLIGEEGPLLLGDLETLRKQFNREFANENVEDANALDEYLLFKGEEAELPPHIRRILRSRS